MMLSEVDRVDRSGSPSTSGALRGKDIAPGTDGGRIMGRRHQGAVLAARDGSRHVHSVMRLCHCYASLSNRLIVTDRERQGLIENDRLRHSATDCDRVRQGCPA